MKDEKIRCETPTPGKKPTNITRWKYDAVKKAILKSIPKNSKGILFKDLAKSVEQHLSPDEKKKLGSIGWYTTCVKLDLEVKGLIKRLPDSSPQRLIR